MVLVKIEAMIERLPLLTSYDGSSLLDCAQAAEKSAIHALKR